MKLIPCLVLAFFILALMGCKPKPIQVPDKPYHHVEGGFRNPPGSIEPNDTFSFEALLFGILFPFRALKTPDIPENHVLDEKVALKQFHAEQNKDSITWIGHMTIILRLDEMIIAIDPWFSDYATPYPPIGPKRAVPPGIALNKLPQINMIVITHNHYDHLDVETLGQLSNSQDITIIVPLGVSRYFKDINFKEVIELDWHQSVSFNGIKYTALPAVHFSRRGAFDRDKSLWAGFAIESSKGKKLFFCEAEYGEVYKQIGKRYGPFDVAMISNGAYLPRSVMQGYHCVPEMGVQIGLDTGAKILVPVHWGTIKLAAENIMESGNLFRQEALKKGIPEERIWLMKIGETRYF